MAGSADLAKRLNQLPFTLPEPGQRFGDYQIIRLLGQGGMGAVFEAEQLESGRRIALKVLSHSLDSADARKRFLREGRLAASVNHPNSVYVFGTEEIEGAPVIVMELVAGGTLQERVKQNGPLPVSEAVDIILQIIAGLEAAAAVGVLHRDIKPSNCFIDPDGTVKVGDFGLSIDTSVRGETNLTLSGVFLGTPAFSPPEQLRGDELDQRSDIYAVGGTLYYLLTGRTPFEGDNLVKLLATVLERAAVSPQKWRREIPPALAAAILRCLEKQAAKRFKNYVELVSALVPFDSTPPQSANLGRRFLAGVIDGITVGLVFLVVITIYAATHEQGMAVLRSGTLPPTWVRTIPYALALLLLALPEGIAGGTFGKLSCGLQVVGRDRNRIGVPRALLRTTVLIVASESLSVFFTLIHPLDEPAFNPNLQLAEDLLSPVALALLFSTARRNNQFAAVHDLLSRSRVFVRRGHQSRIPLTAVPATLPVADTALRIGPFNLLDPLPATASGQILRALDPQLMRPVWIHWLPPGTPPLSERRRTLGRAARMRWLTGNRSEQQCWDAFAAAPGRSLLEILDHRHSWTAVRGWLFDLGEELAAAEKDQSLPAQLFLERVWISTEGRVKLLDFPLPRSEEKQAKWAESHPEQTLAPQVFLNHVALAALEGRIPGRDEAKEQVVRVPVPLRARNLLHTLPRETDLSSWVQSFKPLLGQTGEVSQHTRQISGWTGWLFLSLGLFVLSAMSASCYESWFVRPRCIEFLHHALKRIDEIQRKPQPLEVQLADERSAYEICIRQLDWLVSKKSAKFDDQVQKALTPEERGLAERILDEPRRYSAAEQKAAIARLRPILNELGLSPDERWGLRFPRKSGLFMLSFVGALFFFPLLVIPQVFCGGLLMRLEGIAVVSADGRDASRLRLLARSSFVSALFLPTAMALLIHNWQPTAISLGTVLIWNLPLLAIVLISCHKTDDRALQDRLAKTWLVPR